MQDSSITVHYLLSGNKKHGLGQPRSMSSRHSATSRIIFRSLLPRLEAFVLCLRTRTLTNENLENEESGTCLQIVIIDVVVTIWAGSHTEQISGLPSPLLRNC